MRIKRILVPVDFSPDSRHAVEYARDLAQRFDAEITLLHVVEQIYLAGTRELRLANPTFAKLLDEQWQAAKAHLDRVAGDLRKTRQPFRILMKRGAPAQVIAQFARRAGTDLIIMGTHGRTGLAHVLIGSVAEKVVRSAHCPVLTVRRAPRRTAPGPAKGRV